MNKEFFIKNRHKLSKEMPNKSIAVFFAGKDICTSLDESYPFSINRTFYYFTGINEQNDILLIVKENDKARSIIFINPYDEIEAKWMGRKLSRDEALEISGCDTTRYIKEFEQVALDYAKDGYEIYADTTKCLFEEPYTEERRFEDKMNKENVKVTNIHGLVAKLRTSKEPEEIEEMKKAIHNTNLGLQKVMKSLKGGMYEYQAESIFDGEIKYNGSFKTAFTTIAASGENGCVLHYHANNSKMNDGDLVLFDLGAEYNLYKSDISRTYPVNGKFSPRQREIYSIVLEAQKKVFNAIKPGITIKELNQIVLDHYAKELKRIGLIKNDDEVKKYYFHSVSHHLGLDTHDISGRDMPLTVGSVITDEPGLYIPEEQIGIRIEDDVLVTENGGVWLSKEIIKEIDDIEKFMKD